MRLFYLLISVALNQPKFKATYLHHAGISRTEALRIASFNAS